MKSISLILISFSLFLVFFAERAEAQTIGHPTGNLGNRWLTHPMAKDVYVDDDRPLKEPEDESQIGEMITPGKVYISGNDVEGLPGLEDELITPDGDPEVLISVPRKDDYPLNEEAEDFPNQERRPNQEILEDQPVTDRTPSQAFPRSFPNRNRPSSLDVIRQVQRQLDNLTVHLDNSEILITVAGLKSREAEDFARMLESEYGQIEDLRVIDLANGLSGFAVVLDDDVKRFSEQLEVKSFGPFALELVRFRPRQIDYVVKFY